MRTRKREAQASPSILFWLIYFVFIFIGLCGSLKAAFSLFGIDPDACHSIMLWNGVTSHGLSWVKDWMFTQDNWLLSLTPLHFLGFFLFGASPVVVLLTGWLIFVLAAFVSGAIAWQLEAKRAALLIPVILLFLGLYAHLGGFASYSTTHNVTNLFGLIVLLLIIKWTESRSHSTLLLAFLLLSAGAISDPWMLPAYNLPIGLVGAVLWCLKGTNNRPEFLKLLFASAASILAVKSRLLGTLNFLPWVHFEPGSLTTMTNNAKLLVMDFGGLINISPFHQSNEFLPAFISVSTITILLAANFSKAIQAHLLSQSKYLVFGLFVFFSTGGIFMAFILGSTVAVASSARFLLNALYLVVIGLGVLLDLNWKNSSRVENFCSGSVVMMFLAAGISSNFIIWAGPKPTLKDYGVNDQVDFLEKNNLTYGYGPYWGSSANAVTCVSQSKIHIRPVGFTKSGGMIMGNRAETSRRWYTVEDFPHNQKDFFVFIKSDGVECLSVDLCAKTLSQQFGNPEKTIEYGDAKILVWNHPLLGYQQPARKIDLGERLRCDNLDDPLVWQGWSSPEPLGTWSDGEMAVVSLDLAGNPTSNFELLIDGSAFITENHPLQEVDVVVNGHHASMLRYDKKSNGPVRVVKVPNNLLLEGKGKLHIQFCFKNAKSPAELGLSADERHLGLRVASISINLDNGANAGSGQSL